MRMLGVLQLALASARSRLWIADAYFLAIPSLRETLIVAARAGVDVRILLPATNDLPVVGALSRAGYRPFLDAGVRIWEYAGRDDARQNQRRRRLLGTCRVDQPQRHRLVDQLGDGPAGRGSTVRSENGGMYEEDLRMPVRSSYVRHVSVVQWNLARQPKPEQNGRSESLRRRGFSMKPPTSCDRSASWGSGSGGTWRGPRPIRAHA